MLFRPDVDPTIDDLIDHYVEVYKDTLGGDEDLNWNEVWDAGHKFEKELRNEVLVPAVREVLAKLPLGAAFLERVKEHTEEAEKDAAERLAEAKAKGFDSVEAQWKDEAKARRQKIAQKAAATRAENRLDDAQRLLRGQPGGAINNPSMTMEQARKIVNEHTAQQLLIDNGYVKDETGGWVKPTPKLLVVK